MLTRVHIHKAFNVEQKELKSTFILLADFCGVSMLLLHLR